MRMGLAAGFAICAALGGWAGPAWRTEAAGGAQKNPVPREIGLRLGKALFEENCVICHGSTGAGDGQAAAGLTPRPKNLADRPVQAETDGVLFWKISEGRGAMPGWKRLSERERWSLVHYLRALAQDARQGKM
jgi:mono/diheme cytochrome c family protein